MVVTNCMAVPAGELTYQLTSSAPIPWFFTSVLECQGQINVASVTWCKTLWKGKAWGESQGTNTSIRFMLIYLPFLCPPRQIFWSTCCNSNMWFGWKIGWERYTWAQSLAKELLYYCTHPRQRYRNRATEVHQILFDWKLSNHIFSNNFYIILTNTSIRLQSKLHRNISELTVVSVLAKPKLTQPEWARYNIMRVTHKASDHHLYHR